MTRSTPPNSVCNRARGWPDENGVSSKPKALASGVTSKPKALASGGSSEPKALASGGSSELASGVHAIFRAISEPEASAYGSLFISPARGEFHAAPRVGLAAQVKGTVRAAVGCMFLAAVILNVGCRILNPLGSSLTDHEEAARIIDGDDATRNFRPEGLAAEKKREKNGSLQRLFPGLAARKDIEKAKTEYSIAEESFKRADSLQGTERRDAFRAAAAKYKSAAKNWKSSALEQDALLMMGESYFFAEDYYKAEQAYAELVKGYPRNRYMDHVDSRRFELADYWLKRDSVEHKPFVMVNFTDNRLPLNDTPGHGKRVLEKMRLDNPTGKASDDATMRLAIRSFEKGDYETAADTFSDLRITYPDSEHQFQAQFLELQSLLASYQGPKYSSVPLTDAEKRVKQIAKQFPKEGQEHQKDLNLAYAKIRFLLAERHWEQAEFRRKKKEWGASRYHLNRLQEEFSDTPFAEQAKQALSAIADKPDDPPQYLAPLAKLFPERGAERPWLQNTGDSKSK